MRLRLLASVLLILASTATVAAQSGDQAEFGALLDKFWTAWGTLDPDKAAPFYAKDAGLVFYDLAPLKYNGWGEYETGVLKVFADFESLRLNRNDDLRVSRKGKLAWTTHTVNASIKTKSGGMLELKVRHTAIWERRGKDWLVVHEHVSVPMP